MHHTGRNRWPAQNPGTVRLTVPDWGAILVIDEEGAAGRHIEVAGVCFFRSSAASMEYDLYSDGVIVRAKTKTAPAYPCNPTQLLSVTRGFYPPE